MQTRITPFLIFLFLSLSGHAKDMRMPQERSTFAFHRVVGEPANAFRMALFNAKEEFNLETDPLISTHDIALARLESLNYSVEAAETFQTFEKNPVRYGITILFTARGRDRLYQITQENVNRRLGIIIDGRLLKVSKILEPIKTGQIIIESRLNEQETTQLVKAINKAIPGYSEYMSGLERAQKNEYDKAIALFSKALALNAELVQAYVARALAYDKKSAYEEALQDFSKALEHNPYDPQCYEYRGVVYGKTGDYDRAISDFDKALELKADSVSAYYNRGNAYSFKGNYEQAIKDGSKAIELNPRFSIAYYNRGLAYYYRKEYDKSFKDMESAIELGYKVNPSVFEQVKKAAGSK